MTNNPRVFDLREIAEVTDDEITAAVDTVLEELATKAFPLAKGWTLDLVEMIRTSHLVASALKSDQTQWKRGMVRRAILVAYPMAR